MSTRGRERRARKEKVTFNLVSGGMAAGGFRGMCLTLKIVQYALGHLGYMIFN